MSDDEDDLFNFARKHARRSDPVTSHIAAASAVSLAKQHRGMIAAFLDTQTTGSTIEDIAAGTGLDKAQCFRRMSELEAQQIAHAGDKVPLKTGRPGRLWYAGPAPAKAA